MQVYRVMFVCALCVRVCVDLLYLLWVVFTISHRVFVCAWLCILSNNINCKILERFFCLMCHSYCVVYADYMPPSPTTTIQMASTSSAILTIGTLSMPIVKIPAQHNRYPWSTVIRCMAKTSTRRRRRRRRRRWRNGWMNGKQLNSLNHFPCINIYCFLVMFI